MTPLEIRRTQGNYVNNDAGEFVERQKELDKQTPKPLISQDIPSKSTLLETGVTNL